MKRLCFIEMEGVLAPFASYKPDLEKVKHFLSQLTSFSKKNKIELFLISGYNEPVAKKIFAENSFESYFDSAHFLFVDETYIGKKVDTDKKMHKDALVKDPKFNDTFFKQPTISALLKEKDLNEKDALLLGCDVWSDGYYTTRFSKIDFAIFEGNVMDRGKPIERLCGLAYYNFGFDSVKQLLEKFPQVNNSSLDKYVFEVMKAALIGEDFKESVKQSLLKRMQNN